MIGSEICQASALGLRRKPQPIWEIIQAAEDVMTALNPRSFGETVERLHAPSNSGPFWLTRSAAPDDANVNEASGFYVVGPTESVIFLSKSNGAYASLAHYPLTSHHQRAKSPSSLSYFAVLPTGGTGVRGSV